ncbi:hypothetical protein TSOC_013148, partial [Tetrabaena socialis]
MRAKLEAAAGCAVLDRTWLQGITVHPNGCSLALRPDGADASSPPPAPLTARLVVDCMGHFSPAVGQPRRAPAVSVRWGRKPDGVCLVDVAFKRVLFGFFPTFKDTPLRPAFDRVVHIGDAGGLQSPLSFGGFGALTRHLARLTAAL